MQSGHSSVVSKAAEIQPPTDTGLYLPNVLVCGATKSGTTTLWTFFKEHPEALVGTRKELHFFDEDSRYDRGLAFYSGHFVDHAGEYAIVDATPDYLCFPTVPQRMYECLPDAKLIFIFRNPVDRAHSSYWHGFAKGRPYAPFREAITDPANRDLLEKSRYAAGIKRYLDIFPRDQLLLLLTDQLAADPLAVRRQCYEHAGIDAEFLPSQDGGERRKNRARRPRSVRIQRLAYRHLLTRRRKAQERYRYDSDGRLIGKAEFPARSFDASRRRLYNWVTRLNVERVAYPPLDAATRELVSDLLRDDILAFSKLTGLDTSKWLEHDTA